MANETKIPGNMKTAIRGFLVDDGGLQVERHGVDPRFPTMVSVKPTTDTVTVELTSDVLKKDGSKLTDLTDADIIWFPAQSASADQFFAGDNQLITGVRITGTPTTADIEFSITQVD